MAGYGLRHGRSQGMEGSTGNTAEFNIAVGYTGVIARGDVVRLNAGYLEEASGHADNDAFDILGVFNGCQYIDSDGSLKFKQVWDGGAGRTDIRAQVLMPGHTLFHIKGRTGTTYNIAATIGARFGIDWAAANTMFGESRIQLGAAANAAGPLMVHRLVPLPGGNPIGGAEPVFEVSIVRQQLTGTVPAAAS